MPITEIDSLSAKLALLLLVALVELSTSENPAARIAVVSHNRTCKITEFKCANDRCIQQNYFCNNKNDCGDSSDEPRYCTRKYQIIQSYFSSPIFITLPILI